MTGLVNAIGAQGPVLRESAARTGIHAQAREPAVPIVTSLQATEVVLHSAVENIEFPEGNQFRELPGGEQSDRFDQADVEARGAPQDGLGQRLDVTA